MFELKPPTDDGLYIPKDNEWSKEKHYPGFPKYIRARKQDFSNAEPIDTECL